MKKQVILDGSQMKDEKGAMQYLARVLKFPAGYKGKLEEVEDLLSSIDVPMDIIWLHHEVMMEKLGEFGEELFETVMACAEENDKIGLYVAKSLFEEE
ncbi:MAG: barstar family protein [Lachnospiraceae bacterium]|nr:barstar family protein [Lachnospiraceae bacterium]